MAKQSFSVGQVLTAAQMTSLQQTAMLGGSATAKTTSYTLVAADAGTVVSVNSTSATTITVDAGLFAAGDTVTIQNWGSGAVTITAGTATVNTAGSLIVPQYDGGVLYFTSASAAIYFDFVQAGAVSPLTTKGDLYTFASSDTRLAVGANDTVLTADSSTATGLKWAAVAGGGYNWTLLNTGGTALTGATSITVSGISAVDKIMVLVQSASAGASSEIDIRLNSDTGNNYSGFGMFTRGDTSWDANQIRSYQNANISVINFARQGDNTSFVVSGGITITGCNSSGIKAFQVTGAGSASGGYQNHSYIGHGLYNTSSTISSVTLISSVGNFDAGTMFVYTSA